MTELELENKLLDKLESLGYKKIKIKNYEDLKENLKNKIYELNKEKLKTPLDNEEFKQIYNYLMNGSLVDKAIALRDFYNLKRSDGSEVSIQFFKNSVNDQEEWCKNIFEVAHQIPIGKNRYDVTLLINGLPLVQIELKSKTELKRAFSQIQGYKLESYNNTLFEYIQLFVISNNLHTKYFANNNIEKLNFEFAFNWAKENNDPIHNLFEFSETFLRPCFLAKYIGEYILISHVEKQLFALRPYQYYGVEKIIEKVKLFANGVKEQKGGYIWHTTGSGKTKTSFKASQTISKMANIDKVLFVVDRKDLDIQTVEEYQKFDAEIEGISNTKNLIKQFKAHHKNLIVTTIQKLSKAIKSQELQEFRDKNVVLIFDECHRSQFGKTNADIKRFFKNSIMFGFTGTPIFEENRVDNTTTADVFGECLHKYVITDAIVDKNVLGFLVEYFSVENISSDEKLTEKELLNEKRLEKIADKILQIHNQKTKNRKFNALFATASKEMAMMYYDIFKQKNHNLKIGIIFTYAQNEDIDSEPEFKAKTKDLRSKDFLQRAIDDYNAIFDTNFSADDIQSYYDDVQKKIKENKLDITIVVGMLLTGFDHKKLNTLYVDKDLKYHNLIQAFSRTNRIFNEQKPYGNIVAFRDLKENLDEALKLFGNPNKNDKVLKEEYSVVKTKFLEKWEVFKNIFISPDEVDKLTKSEEKQVEFVKLFRELLKLKSSLETYTEFSFEDVKVDEKEWFDYITYYLDLYEVSKKENSSPISNVDFSIELVRSDVINYDYIIKLLEELKGDNLLNEDYDEKKENFLKQLDRDIKLRNKKSIIEEFIDTMLQSTPKDKIQEKFEEFWKIKKEEYLKNLAKDINANEEKLRNLIKEYEFSKKLTDTDIIKILNFKISIFNRSKKLNEIHKKITDFVKLFKWEI